MRCASIWIARVILIGYWVNHHICLNVHFYNVCEYMVATVVLCISTCVQSVLRSALRISLVLSSSHLSTSVSHSWLCMWWGVTRGKLYTTAGNRVIMITVTVHVNKVYSYACIPHHHHWQPTRWACNVIVICEMSKHCYNITKYRTEPNPTPKLSPLLYCYCLSTTLCCK